MVQADPGEQIQMEPQMAATPDGIVEEQKLP